MKLTRIREENNSISSDKLTGPRLGIEKYIMHINWKHLVRRIEILIFLHI